jgi:hypothetical protein
MKRHADARSDARLVICLDTAGYGVSLISRKLYELLPDPVSNAYGLYRIVDESCDDYCYPASLFIPAILPKQTEERLQSVG